MIFFNREIKQSPFENEIEYRDFLETLECAETECDLTLAMNLFEKLLLDAKTNERKEIIILRAIGYLEDTAVESAHSHYPHIDEELTLWRQQLEELYNRMEEAPETKYNF